MKICFPVQRNDGLNSVIFNHFGSAPLFIVVDTATGTLTALDNGDAHHSHGACSPLKALGGHKVDAIVVGGIGAGALQKLQAMGVKVFRTAGPTIREHVAGSGPVKLSEYTLNMTCASRIGGLGHGKAHGCAH